jgi:hypothetical protein
MYYSALFFLTLSRKTNEHGTCKTKTKNIYMQKLAYPLIMRKISCFVENFLKIFIKKVTLVLKVHKIFY